MKKELSDQFNSEVESYRKALLSFARRNEWEAFKTKAGALFDYVETIESFELERKFFTVFSGILALLILSIIVLLGVDFGARPELMRVKYAFILSALAASTFDLYFFLNFRLVMHIKAFHYKERRETFIRDIQRDFTEYTHRRE